MSAPSPADSATEDNKQLQSVIDLTSPDAIARFAPQLALNRPSLIAFSHDHSSVFIFDTNNHAIIRVDANAGANEHAFLRNTLALAIVALPRVTLDQDAETEELIAVSTSAEPKLTLYRHDGTLYAKCSVGAFSPTFDGLCCGPKRTLFVSDSARESIVKVGADLQLTRTFRAELKDDHEVEATTDPKEPPFISPGPICTDRQCRFLFVVETSENRIQVWTPDDHPKHIGTIQTDAPCTICFLDDYDKAHLAVTSANESVEDADDVRIFRLSFNRDPLTLKSATLVQTLSATSTDPQSRLDVRNVAAIRFNRRRKELLVLEQIRSRITRLKFV